LFKFRLCQDRYWAPFRVSPRISQKLLYFKRKKELSYQMIAYKKQRRRVDPVKQILARLDEKQSKLGLSLYSRSSNVCSEKEDGLPVVQPFTEAASTSNKSSAYFPDLSVARQKVHKRLNAGLKHSMTESHHVSQAKVNRQLNQTFPPTKSYKTSALVNQRKESYSFGGWSDTPSVGVENIRNSHYTSMNPFGYNRRTLAFQPTSLNYVVEWPETWPLKIMSLNGKGTRRPYKKKEKTKHKVLPKVHFEGSSAPFPSPEVMSKRNKKTGNCRSGDCRSRKTGSTVIREYKSFTVIS